MSFPTPPPEEPNFTPPEGVTPPPPPPPPVPPAMPPVPPAMPPVPPAMPPAEPPAAPPPYTPPPAMPPAAPPPPAPPVSPMPAGAPSPYVSQATGVNIGEAFTWSLEVLKKNLGVLVGLAAIPAVINFIVNSYSRSQSGKNPGVITFIILLLLAILSFLAEVGIRRAALKRTKGINPAFDMVLSGENLLPFILTVIVMTICIALGAIAFCIGALIVAVLLWFADWHSLDTGAGIGEAFSKSYRQVTGNLGAVILLILISLAGGIVSLCTCGLGTFVVTPFLALMTAHVYRQVNGEAIAPA